LSERLNENICVAQAFTIFCGLGINNCLLYDEKARAAAQQAVALEVLRHFRFLITSFPAPTNAVRCTDTTYITFCFFLFTGAASVFVFYNNICA